MSSQKRLRPVEVHWDFGETAQFKQIFGTIEFPSHLTSNDFQTLINKVFGNQTIRIVKALPNQRGASININKPFKASSLKRSTLWLDLPSGSQKYVPEAVDGHAKDILIDWELVWDDSLQFGVDVKLTGYISVSPDLSAASIKSRFQDFFKFPVQMLQKVTNLKVFNRNPNAGFFDYKRVYEAHTAFVIKSIGSLVIQRIIENNTPTSRTSLTPVSKTKKTKKD